MKGMRVKAVKIHYFTEYGSLHETVEEMVPMDWSYDFIVEELKKRRKYSTLDMVILDSGDGVAPYIAPYLDKIESSKEDHEVKGFFA